MHVLAMLLLFTSGDAETCEGVTGPKIVELRNGAFVREYRPAWTCRVDGDGRVVLSEGGTR